MAVLDVNSFDIPRLAEFFDGDRDCAVDFVRSVWLPEAVRTLQLLVISVGVNRHRALFLCDHYREGARTTGAVCEMSSIDTIESAICDDRESDAVALIHDALERLLGTYAFLRLTNIRTMRTRKCA